MPKLCVRRIKKIYWINLTVSWALATLTAILLKPILPVPFAYPVAGFPVMFLTAYPFFRELARVAGRQLTFARHAAYTLLGTVIGAVVGYLLEYLFP